MLTLSLDLKRTQTGPVLTTGCGPALGFSLFKVSVPSPLLLAGGGSGSGFLYVGVKLGFKALSFFNERVKRDVNA